MNNLSKLVSKHTKYIYIFIISLACCLIIGNLSSASKAANQELVHLNVDRLALAKEMIKKGDPIFLKAYEEVIATADLAIEKEIDPVTNKTVIPASGDIHDYYTLSPYHWPDPEQEDGLPWVYRDGEFNPINKGSETDWTRLKGLFSSLNSLNLAYYFSGETQYMHKAREIIRVWFINKATKVNPNVNHGQAIPGKLPGTNFAIIDWVDIGKVITTIQLLESNHLWSGEEKQVMDQWLTDFSQWLLESEFGVLERTRLNNHGCNYDYLVAGILIYLEKMDEATAIIESVKTQRIATQIDPDGSQPRELARTKSVNYTVNNLWALVRIADLGRRFTDVDLWSYESDTGASLKKAFEFVNPYFTQKSTWKWKQIIGGGADSQLANLALPMFSKTELMLNEKIVPEGLCGYDKFKAHEVLMYAPIHKSKKYN